LKSEGETKEKGIKKQGKYRVIDHRLNDWSNDKFFDWHTLEATTINGL